MFREGSYMADPSSRVADRLLSGAFPIASRYNPVRTKTPTALATPPSSETSDLMPALTNRHAANALEARNLFEHLNQLVSLIALPASAITNGMQQLIETLTANTIRRCTSRNAQTTCKIALSHTGCSTRISGIRSIADPARSCMQAFHDARTPSISPAT